MASLFRTPVCSVLALALALGCASDKSPDVDDDTTSANDAGDTADSGDTGEPSDGGSSSACIDTPTMIAADEASPLGFSAQDLLADKVGARQTELRFANEPTSLSDAYKNLVLPLEVTLTYAAGEVRWVTSVPDPKSSNDGLDDGLFECHDRLEVDVTLDFVTEGGELDEHLTATLQATAVDRATLVGSMRVTEGVDLHPEPGVQGSFDPDTLFDDPEITVEKLFVFGTWYQELAGGALWVEIRSDAGGDGGWVGFGSLATWGDEIPFPEE